MEAPALEPDREHSPEGRPLWFSKTVPTDLPLMSTWLPEVDLPLKRLHVVGNSGAPRSHLDAPVLGRWSRDDGYHEDVCRRPPELGDKWTLLFTLGRGRGCGTPSLAHKRFLLLRSEREIQPRCEFKQKESCWIEGGIRPRTCVVLASVSVPPLSPRLTGPFPFHAKRLLSASV